MLAVTAERRMARWPDLPTFRELGYDIVASAWFGLSGPAGPPEAIADRLSTELLAVLAEPPIAQRLDELGLGHAIKLSRAQFTAFVAEEVARWAPIVRASGAQPDRTGAAGWAEGRDGSSEGPRGAAPWCRGVATLAARGDRHAATAASPRAPPPRRQDTSRKRRNTAMAGIAVVCRSGQRDRACRGAGTRAAAGWKVACAGRRREALEQTVAAGPPGAMFASPRMCPIPRR